MNNGREDKLIFTKKFDKTGMNIIYYSITKKLNNMNFIFNNCSTLKKIDFISLETDEVTDMKSMFQSCCNLENLDLTNFNTSKVINMARMFNGCNKLKQIDGINKFNTYNVTNMREMFSSCSQLESLDLSNFDISNVKDKESIFYGCNKLKQIKGGEKFNQVKNKQKNEITISPNEQSFDDNISMGNNSHYHGYYSTALGLYGYSNFSNPSISVKKDEDKSCCSCCGTNKYMDDNGHCSFCSNEGE